MTMLSKAHKVGVIWLCALGLLLAALAPSLPARLARLAGPARAQGVAEFVAMCPLAHRLPDDPIVFPNQPGVSHHHTFFGATTANAFSTADSLFAGGTTCNPVADRSSYWMPTVLENGQPVPVGSRNIFYYLGNTITDRASIKAFPFGLMMIAGDASSTTQPNANGRRYDWTCLGVAMPVTAEIPTCPQGSELEFHLFYPECWDGIHLDSPNHKSHMAYAVSGACPATHPVAVPRVFFLITFQTLGGPNVTVASFLSGPNGNAYTAHGDFFNAWDPAELERRVQHCLNVSVICGPAGPSQGPSGPTATRIATRTPVSGTALPTATTNPAATATRTSTASAATATRTATASSGGGCGTGTNMVANPGFEAGTLSPWTLATGNGGATQARVYSGGWSGYVGTSLGRIEQVVGGLAPSTTYTLCGWFTLEAPGSTTQLGVKNFGGTTVVKTVTTSASFVWAQHSLTFTTGASNTSATIFFEQPTSGGNYGYSDGWWLSSGGAAPSATRTSTPGGTLPTATRTATRTSTAGSGARSALLVVGALPLSGGDSAIQSRLQALGFSVTAVAAAGSTSADASGKSLVYISSTVESGDVGGKFTSVAVPLVTTEQALFDDLRLTGTTSGTSYGNATGQTQVSIVSPGHPLAAGLSGTVTVVAGGSTFSWGAPASGAIRVAALPGSSTRFTVFGYESGAGMVGMSAPARRVGWITEATTALNANGWALFDAAVRWAAGM